MADVEILVHTSAPSRGPDDARYRALAQAYLQFVPATRQKLDIEVGALRDEQVNGQLHEKFRRSTQDGPESWESYRPDDEEDDHEIEESEESELFPTQPESHDHVADLKALDSPRLSFDSVDNNADSPVFRAHVKYATSWCNTAEETQKSTDSWQMPPSTIADSQPEHNKNIGAFSSPTRMLEFYLQQIESSDLESPESDVRRRQQSIIKAPTRKRTSQLSQNSDVRDLRYDGTLEYSDQSELPSMIRDTPARVVASPILGNPTPSDASSPESLSSSLAPVSSMPPPQNSSMAKSQLDLTSNDRKGEVVTPLASSLDSNDWGIDTSLTRRKSPARESVGTVQPPNPLPSKTPDRVQVSSSKPDSSSFRVQVPKTSTLGTSSQMGPNSRISSGRIPETPYHVPSTQDPSTGQKRSWPGVPSENDQIPASAPADVRVVSTSVEVEGIQPQAKRRRLEDSTDRFPSSIPEIPPTKNTSEQPAAEPQQRSQTEKVASESSTRSNSSVSNSPREPLSPTKSQLISYSSHTTITPTPPETSSNSIDPISFITPCLSSLSEKLPLSKLYYPAQQSRPLRQTERGYWLVNCSPWPDSLRKRCWDCLGNFVGKGRAGWGVRCERDEEWQWIRVYCWGIVVDYIYLLLFMGSENKVKKVDCTWIAGDGKALITMPKIS